MKTNFFPLLTFPAAILASALLFGVSAALVSQAHAQGGVPLWTNRNNVLVPQAIAVDSSGNAFVTGGSDGGGGNLDYATVSYSGAGLPLWTNRYDGPSGGIDVPQVIAVDNAGNVFVTGGSHGSGGDWDYTTVAYSAAGVPLWGNCYNGPGYDLDRARAIAVDSAGNVFVTGWSYSGSDFTTEDFATVAYSGAGVPLWTNRYEGPGNDIDEADAIAVDSSGNVFVTGGSSLGGGVWDFVTLAYSGAGAPLWTNRYNGTGTGSDYASAIAVDNRGNVFVTGVSVGNGSDLDFATVAYSGAGLPLWTNRYNGPGNNRDGATAIAVDSSGNVFVTGSSYRSSSSTSSDYATVAYSGAGVPLWTNRYNGPGSNADEPRAIAVDSSGNVFVTGVSWRGSVYTSADYATVAYSGAGVPLWTNRYNGPLNNEDIANAIAVDRSGNVFVTGSSAGTGAVTIKYSSSVRARLDIQRLDDQVVLSWTDAGFSLQSAPAVAGTFTNVPGAISPYTNSITGLQQCFRLKAP